MRRLYLKTAAFSLLFSSLLFSLISCDGGSDAVAAGSVISVRLNGSTQSIPSNTWTSINFDSESFDTDTMHDNTTNTSRITINTAGLYLIQGTVQFATDLSGRRQCAIILNPATTSTTIGVSGLIGNVSNILNVSSIYRLEQGDYMVLNVFQDCSTGALNAGFSLTTFTAVRLGD